MTPKKPPQDGAVNKMIMMYYPSIIDSTAPSSSTGLQLWKYVCDYRQRIDYFLLLSIVNDEEKITGKNSIKSACNLSYRLKRSGPLHTTVGPLNVYKKSEGQIM